MARRNHYHVNVSHTYADLVSCQQSGRSLMSKIVFLITLYFFVSATSGFAGEEPAVVYWDSEAGKTLRARIPADADYWLLSTTFAVQSTQTYCSVASAITILNAMPVKKPVDPAYTPFAYFTQSNYFTPEVIKIISPQTVLSMGMTRECVFHGYSATDSTHIRPPSPRRSGH